MKTDEAVLKGQTVREPDIAFNADNVEYPYSLNLNDYMTSSQINGVIASTVMGLDDEDEEISSTYSNGIIRFSDYPTKVKYNYGTGLTNLSMDVTISSGNTYTGMVTYNNHFYRIFTSKVDTAPLSGQFTLYSDNPEAYYDGLEFYGAIPEPTDLSHLTDNPPVTESVFASAALPSQYDLRDYGHITSIKNHNTYGICRAFAAIGVLESNYLVQNNGRNAPDLSELHLAWYAFMDSGQGYSFPLNDVTDSILNQGGFHSMPIAMLSRMAGPAPESDLPYSHTTTLRRKRIMLSRL